MLHLFLYFCSNIHLLTKVSHMKQLVFTFLFLMVTLFVFGQRKITGLVTNAAGEPQIGANIAVKDAPASGSITDFDGKY